MLQCIIIEIEIIEIEYTINTVCLNYPKAIPTPTLHLWKSRLPQNRPWCQQGLHRWPTGPAGHPAAFRGQSPSPAAHSSPALGRLVVPVSVHRPIFYKDRDCPPRWVFLGIKYKEVTHEKMPGRDPVCLYGDPWQPWEHHTTLLICTGMHAKMMVDGY